jgi:hypothetical protein
VSFSVTQLADLFVPGSPKLIGLFNKIFDMKSIILFLFLPVISFSRDLNDAPKKLLRFGLDINTVTKLANTNNKEANKEVTFHLVPKLSMIGNVKAKDVVVVSANGSVKAVSVIFDQQNGMKFQKAYIKQFGMPGSATIADNLQWTDENSSLEIRQEGKNIVVNYKQLPYSVERKQAQQEFNWDLTAN